MKYELRLSRLAEKEMDQLPTSIYDRVDRRLRSLQDHPRPVGVKKLSGREEYRLRVGDYRILYGIDDRRHTVTIIGVGHRREVYR